ncbi:MAG: ribonuclease H-like domain-containing protein [Dehalococcoidia bacterium]|nr:ribonuclease H-like domain-containing protein [Dehalococcoidia bacterium]
MPLHPLAPAAHPPRAPPPDLLHPNRRLFKGVIESHRLPMVERELLGSEREDDASIRRGPERYFRFQRSGDPTHIRPVLRHNAWDILSLVALAAHLAAVCDDGASHPLQAARAAEYAGEHAAAARHYETALATVPGRAERLESLERAARCHTRTGEWEAAAAHWQSSSMSPGAAVCPPLRRTCQAGRAPPRRPPACLRPHR